MIDMVQPAIVAASQSELEEKLLQFPGFRVHLDAMRRHFVDNSSLEFDGGVLLPENPGLDQKYTLHVMADDPMEYLCKYFSLHTLNKVDTVLIHAEIDPGILANAISELYHLKKRIGLVLRPETPAVHIADVLKGIDEVLKMTVHPGMQGASFLQLPLSEIAELRKMGFIREKGENGFRGVIGVDGGVSMDTIETIALARPDYVAVGSYMRDAVNKREAAERLQAYLV
jgi:ribulose-phosphate 3-epimerase